MLPEVVAALVCPVCRTGLDPTAAAMRCASGHSFDLARQGYLNLLAGLGRRPLGADDSAAVAARVDFLTAGHFASLVAEIVSATVAAWPGDLVVDVGSGPGHYLAAVLDALPEAAGLALDSSVAALRRAARVHPRAAAVGWDLREPLPLRDEVAGVVLDVFAPRNAVEYARVLRRDGRLVVVVPGPGHLGELVTGLGLIGVDAAKADRLAAALDPWFELTDERAIGYGMRLSRDEVRAAVAMGPNAWHVGAEELTARVALLPVPCPVRVEARVLTYRRR